MANPLLAIIAISFFLSIFNQWAFMKFADISEINRIKGEIKDSKKKLKELKPASKEYSKHQSGMMEKSLQMTKLSMRPSMYTILPFWGVFAFLKSTFAGVGIIMVLPVSLPFVGNSFGWLGSYIIFSIVFSLILRKLFEKYLWTAA